MKLLRPIPAVFALLTPLALRAQEAPAHADWHAHSLPEALAHTGIFAICGIIIAILGYKLFDLCTPGRLHDEIIQNKNVAAAIVGGAVILGVSIIVAASMLG
jgi:uncharacterized membrane protein YjfL (UPF0719 family)